MTLFDGSIRKSGRLHLRAFIAFLVLVPLASFLIFAAVAARPRYVDWRRAQEIERRVNRITLLLALENAIAEEELPTQVVVSARELNIQPKVVALLMGFDPIEVLKTKQRLTDEMLIAAKDDPIASEVKRLTLAIRKLALSEVSGVQLSNAYSEIHESMRSVLTAELKTKAVMSLNGNSRLHDELKLLLTSLELSSTIGRQHQRILDAINSKSKNDPEIARALALHLDQERELISQMDSLVKGRKRDLEQFVTTSNNSTVVAEIRGYVGGAEADVASSPARIATAVESGLQRNTAVDVLQAKFSSDSIATAARMNADALRALQVTLAMSLVLILLTTLLAVRIARFLSKPLLNLATSARLVADGDLDVPPVDIRGPYEIAIVAKVVNDLVANLRRVQGQAAALAKGEIDDSILLDPIPGALGLTMKASVDRLSRSIREREQLQEQLSQQATHDVLTGLPNRAAAVMALEQAAARSRRTGQVLAVLFIDLDDFKRANDDHNHAVGDEVLRISGQRILSVVRVGDIVARLGGDEFLVIADAVGSAAATRELADRIVESLAIPMIVDEVSVRVGASVGFALLDDAVENAGDLLRRADLAMYRAKELGRGRVVEFDERLSREFEEKHQLQNAMAVALEENQLSLQFQPILSSATGAMLSVEALLRWDRPGFGSQSPARFIPILESSPLILEIGRWVLIQATKELAALRLADAAFAHVSVAVNLSGRHLLAPSLINDIETALLQSGLPPELLTVEITETALVTDLMTVIESMKAIRGLGVKIAIDDFGTGYTSIGQLSRLPVNILKIDRAFVDQIAIPASQRIVELIIEVGHTLALDVVAEGVEDESQREALARLGCDRLQGYLLGHPLLIGELETFVAERPFVRQ
jgi:diguanylate cyclase (GGDEF)-like protein